MSAQINICLLSESPLSVAAEQPCPGNVTMCLGHRWPSQERTLEPGLASLAQKPRPRHASRSCYVLYLGGHLNLGCMGQATSPLYGEVQKAEQENQWLPWFLTTFQYLVLVTHDPWPDVTVLVTWRPLYPYDSSQLLVWASWNGFQILLSWKRHSF